MYQPLIHQHFTDMRRHDLEERAINYRRARRVLRARAVTKHRR